MSVAAAAPIVDVAASARTHPEASYTWTTLQRTACKRKVSFKSSFDLQSRLISVSALMRAAQTGARMSVAHSSAFPSRHTCTSLTCMRKTVEQQRCVLTNGKTRNSRRPGRRAGRIVSGIAGAVEEEVGAGDACLLVVRWRCNALAVHLRVRKHMLSTCSVLLAIER